MTEPEFSAESDPGEDVAKDDGDFMLSDECDEEEEQAEREFASKKRTRSSRSSRKATKSSKRKRLSGRNFMDVEAAVGGGDEEDEEKDYEEDADFLREAKEAQQVERELDLAQRRRLNMSLAPVKEARGAASHLATAIGSLERRFQDQDFVEEGPGIDEEEEEEDAEDEEQLFARRKLFCSENKLEKNGGVLLHYIVVLDGRDADPTRFLPDVKNAQLWKIRTVKGVSEREIVISIMNKFVHMRQKGRPFPLLSAFAPDAIRGHIYVEAANPGQIREALKGFRSIMFSTMKIVPINEMNAVFAMGDQKNKVLNRNELVRFKGGLYANDLAQVTDFDEQNGAAWVRVVPRINLSELLDQKMGPPEKSRLIVARLLTREEIEANGGIVEPGHSRGTFRFAGKIFTESGYLLRKVRPQLLITGADVSPTVQELKEFGRGLSDAEDELGSWQRLTCVRKSVYNIGDRVVVHSGDVKGLQGTVVSFDGGHTVEVQPEDQTLQNVVSIAAKDLVKLFQVGDSVKAIGGFNNGASGLVTSVDLNSGVATVFYPALGQPFSCLLDHLQSCPNSGVAAVGSLGGFSVGDLVRLGEHKTGLIVQIDPGGALSVLTPDDKLERVPLSCLAATRSNAFAVALDRNNVKFGTKAAVTVAATKAVGRVCHIWKNHVFIKLSSKDAGHFGFCVCDSKDLLVRAADGAVKTPGPLPSLGSYNTRNGSRGGGFSGPRGSGGPRGWTGQRVRVTCGRNKGSFGEILSHESGGRLRIRLSQNDITVCLNRDEIIILGGPSDRRGRGGGAPGGFAHHGGRALPTASAEQAKSWSSYFQSVRDSHPPHRSF